MKRCRVRHASAWTDGTVFTRVRIREGDERAAEALFSHLHGIGPVSPTPCAFGEGVLTEGFALRREGICLPRNSAWLAAQYALHATPIRRWVGLSADVQAVEARLEKSARWAQARFGIHCAVCRVDRASARNMARVLQTEEEPLFRALSRLPLGTRVLLAEKNGQPAGFLLLLVRFRCARAATAWVVPECRRTGVLPVLAYHACLTLDKRHISRCDISMIDEENTASLRVAEGLGAHITRRFAMYQTGHPPR